MQRKDPDTTREAVALDADETARLTKIAEAYSTAPRDVAPPSDRDLELMRREITRVDGAKYANRNPHPFYVAALYLGSVRRDAQEREDQARHDARGAEAEARRACNARTETAWSRATSNSDPDDKD